MIYLASQSPRRRELLSQIGISYELVSVDIDETPKVDEDPADYVIRMAVEKARHAWHRDMRKPLLAADTTVVADGRILGKPADRDDFLQMIDLLSGNTHQVMTAIAVSNGQVKSRLNVSEVSFRPVSRSEAERYWATGEPADKAGGYAIQGLAAVFISRVSGSYSGVMGLPLFETAELLHEYDVTIL
jgi:septum formation protein